MLLARFTSYNGVEVLKSIDAMSWGRGEHGRLHRTLKSRDTRGKAIQYASVVHNNFPTCSNWSLKWLLEHIDPALHADTFPLSIDQVPVVSYLITVQPGSAPIDRERKLGASCSIRVRKYWIFPNVVINVPICSLIVDVAFNKCVAVCIDWDRIAGNGESR